MKEGSSNNFSRTRSPRQVKKYGSPGKLSCSPEKQKSQCAYLNSHTHIRNLSRNLVLHREEMASTVSMAQQKYLSLLFWWKMQYIFIVKKIIKTQKGQITKSYDFLIYTLVYAFWSFSTLLCVYVYWCLFYIGDCIYLLFSLLLT